MATRIRTAFLLNSKEYFRNKLALVFLIVLPFLFITASFRITPRGQILYETTENGVESVLQLSMPEFHGAIMAPITATFLAGLAGVFMMLSSKDADRRLVLAGYKPSEIIVSRLSTLALVTLLVTVVSVGVTLEGFTPVNIPLFSLSIFLSAFIYGSIGVLVGNFTEKTGGAWLMFSLPMLDFGLVSFPLLTFTSVTPPLWMKVLPGYSTTKILMDASFTRIFDTVSYLFLAISYLLIVWGFATAAFYKKAKVR
ncbi:MAG: ABC transporter permease [Candidatus Heimdallarchaeota archaeon]